MTPARQHAAAEADDATIDIIDDGQPAVMRPHSDDLWDVLVVDDDPDVHDVTRFSLGEAEILGKRLNLMSAFSASEAKALLASNPGAAVLLLDVVMEEHDAGLQFVRWMRDQGYDKPRVILRTGQPGYAPELDVVRNYDINDYRAKDDLNQTRLITSLTAALRSFTQIETIERSRRGLELVVSNCSQLFEKRELASFSNGVLMQIASLCGVQGEGLVCATDADENGDIKIVSAVGDAARYIGRSLHEMPDTHVLKQPSLTALRDGGRGDGTLTLSFDVPSQGKFIASLENRAVLDDTDAALLGVFAANVAVGFENVGLIGRLDKLAFWDQPTQMMNRNALLRQMSAPASQAANLVLLRVVSYSDTVIAFGQEVATSLLREVARHLESGPNCSRVYRYAEDILAVMVVAGGQQESIVRGLAQQSFSVAGQNIRARFATGYAPLAEDIDPAAICDRAYAAVSLGELNRRGEPVEFDGSIIASARSRIELTTALRDAVDQGAIDIVFQPLVRVSDEVCVGVEALARWKRGETTVSPMTFIPLAEQTGLSLQIFAIGVERAAEWLRTRATDQSQHYVSVNLSACDLEHEQLVPFVMKLLGRTQMPASALQIEITEQSLVEDVAKSRSNLLALKALGCRIAVDDFGTGYSSLSYIGKLPIDVLKLDRQFVVGLKDDAACQAVAILTLELARRLNIELLAEGVETSQQLEALREIGFRYVQGYHFARPMAPDQLNRWLAERTAN